MPPTCSARLKSMIQFVSHVSPSSSENACSQRGVGVVTPDHVKRTRIGRPLERVVALEDADVVRERADHRRIEQAGAPAVRPVDRPEAGAGSKKRKDIPTKPPPYSVQNTSSFPRPPGSGRAATFASNSSQSSEPARRLARRRFRTSHLPIQKSKSVDVARSLTAAVTSHLPVVAIASTLSRQIGRISPLSVVYSRSCSRRRPGFSSSSSSSRRSH